MTTFDAVLTEAVSSGASDVYFLEGVAPAIKVDGLVNPVAGADALDAAAMRGHSRAAPAGARADGLRGGRRGEPVAHAPDPRSVPRELLPGDGGLGRGAPPGEDRGADARVTRPAVAPGEPGARTPGTDPPGRARRARGNLRPSPPCSTTASRGPVATWSRSRTRSSSCTTRIRASCRSARWGSTPNPTWWACATRSGRPPTSSSSASSGIPRPWRSRCTPPRPATWSCRPFTRRTRRRPSSALLNFFQPEVRTSMLLQLSLTLRGRGRAAARVPASRERAGPRPIEIMLVTPRIQALIRRGELETMRQAIEEGTNEGLQTFDQALFDLSPAEGDRAGRRRPLRRQPEQPPAPHEGDPLGGGRRRRRDQPPGLGAESRRAGRSTAHDRDDDSDGWLFRPRASTTSSRNRCRPGGSPASTTTVGLSGLDGPIGLEPHAGLLDEGPDVPDDGAAAHVA